MTYTYTQTFTRTHAKHLASKVVADLYQCWILYDNPGREWLDAYQEELITLLAGGYLQTYEFGFKKEEKRILSWYYTVGPTGDLESDSRSGNLTRGVAVGSASFFNYITYSYKWLLLTPDEKAAIKESLPFQRSFGSPPSDGAGYWTTEKRYSAGGMAVTRKVFKPW